MTGLVQAIPIRAIAQGRTRLTVARLVGALLAAVFLGACQPSDRTPGLWLRGDVAESLPDDWRFTDDHPEIFVEVATPWLIPHSVTIWCAQVDGRLFIGARDPESKQWPDWVDADPDIRLEIGDTIYAVAAAEVSDDQTLLAVQAAYAQKYDLGETGLGARANVRYWSIVPRD